MKIGERLLLILLAILLVCLMAVLGVAVWYGPFLDALLSVIASSVFLKILVSACLLLFAILGIRAVFIGVGSSRKNVAMAASTNEGNIYINLTSICALAVKAGQKVDQVLGIRVHTEIAPQGADIAVKACLADNAVIPEVSAEIQKSIKADVEAMCGIAVHKVVVQIDNDMVKSK